VYVLRQNCRAAGWRWDSSYKINQQIRTCITLLCSNKLHYHSVYFIASVDKDDNEMVVILVVSKKIRLNLTIVGFEVK
jgi:hypothetical protein